MPTLCVVFYYSDAQPIVDRRASEIEAVSLVQRLGSELVRFGCRPVQYMVRCAEAQDAVALHSSLVVASLLPSA